MANQPLDLVELKEILRTRLARQRKVIRWVMLGVHTAMFVGFGIGAVLMLAAAGEGMSALPRSTFGYLYGAVTLLFTGWGSGLLFHFIATLSEIGVMSRNGSRLMLSKALADQVLKELEQIDLEKPKRNLADDSQPMTISDEGELIPETEARRNSTMQGKSR